MQYGIGEPPDFYQILHIYVMWCADYEYNSQNCRPVAFMVKPWKNLKNNGFERLFQQICKVTQNILNIICRPHRDKHFLLHAFFSKIDSCPEN